MQAKPIKCPSTEELRQYDAGTVSGDRQAFIDGHLEQCEHCLEFLLAPIQSKDSLLVALEVRDQVEIQNTVLRALVDRGIEIGRQEALETVTSAELNSTQGPETVTQGQREPNSSRFPAVPGFEILSELGKGGMGVVYEARQLGLNRRVALKMILPHGIHNEDAIKRFSVEAESVARLEHPNIVRIHEVGEVNGAPYFSLEFVSQGSLRGLMKADTISPAAAADLIAKIAGGVEFAHGRGVVHRDLKPANILLADGVPGEDEASDIRSQSCQSRDKTNRSGSASSKSVLTVRPKIADFGLARLTDIEDQRQTRTGAVMGTPTYMAPEQAAGRTYDCGPPVDIYALGVMLYELLTGRVPFRAESVTELLQLIQTTTPVTPKRLQPGLHRDLETICMKCLEKEPEKRYMSAGELRADLLRYLRGEPILARPVGSFERSYRWARRKPVVASLLTAVVLLCIAMVIVPTVFAINLKVANATALSEKQEAQRQEAIAKEKESEAIRAREIADRRYVASVINLAGEAYDDGDASQAAALLESVRPKFDEPDYRNFDWYNLWEQCFGKQRRQYLGHRGGVLSLAVSSDDTQLYSTGIDRTLRIWDAKSGSKVQTIEFDELPTCIACSDDRKPEDRYLVCGFPSGELQTYRYRDEQWVHVNSSHLPLKHLVKISFFPGSRRILTGGERSILVHDVESATDVYLKREITNTLRSLATAKDGSFAIIVNDPQVDVWKETDEGWSSNSISSTGEDIFPSAIAFDSTGTHLAICYREDVRIVRTSDLAEISRHDKRSGISIGLALDLAGNRIVYAGVEGVDCCNLETGEIESLPHRSNVNRLLLSSDRQEIFAGTNLGPICQWSHRPTGSSSSAGETPTQNQNVEPIRKIETNRTLTDCRAAPDGKTFAVAQWFGGFSLYDIASAKQIAHHPVRAGHQTRMSFSSDSKRLAVGLDNGKIDILNTDDLSVISQLDAHLGYVECVSFSPDGRSLASCAQSEAIKVWDLDQGTCIAEFPSSEMGIALVEYSPDGKRIAAAQTNRLLGSAVFVWNLESRKLEQRVPIASGLSHIRFSPDGTQIALGTSVGSIAIHDARSWAFVANLSGHSGGLTSLEFTKDGKNLFSLGQDNTLRYWDVSLGQQRCNWKWPNSFLGMGMGLVDQRSDIPGPELVLVGGRNGRIEFLHAATDEMALSFDNELNPEDSTNPSAIIANAAFLQQSNRLSGAREQYSLAANRLKILVEQFPTRPEYQHQLATALLGLSKASKDNKSDCLRDAVEFAESAVNASPDERQYRRTHRNCVTALASHYQDIGQAKFAKQVLDEFANGNVSSIALAESAILLACTPSRTREDDAMSLKLARRAFERKTDGMLEELALGIASYRMGDLDESHKHLRATSLDYQHGPLRWHFVSMLHAKRGESEAATMWLRRALSGHTVLYQKELGIPESSLAHLREEAKQLAGGEWQKELNPDEEALWWYESGLQVRDEVANPRWSLEYFQRSIELDEDALPCILAAVEVCNQTGDEVTEMAWLDHGIRKHPKEPKLWELRAKTSLRRNRNIAANDYLRLAEFYPENLEYWMQAAKIARPIYRIEMVRSALAEVLKRDPDHAEALTMMIETHIANPEHAMLRLHQLGKLPERMWSTAEAAFDKRGQQLRYGSTDDSQRRQARSFWIARARILTDQLTSQKSDESKGNHLKTDLGWTHLKLYEFERDLGTSTDAKRHADALLQTLSEDLETRAADDPRTSALSLMLTYGNLQAEDSRFHELVARIAKKYPQNGSLQNALGVGHAKNGRWTAAINAFERAEALKFAETDLFLKSLAYLQLGEQEKSKDQFDKANQAWEALTPWRQANAWQAGVMNRHREQFVAAQTRLQEDLKRYSEGYQIVRGDDGEAKELSAQELEALKILLAVISKTDNATPFHEAFLFLQQLGELPLNLRWTAGQVLSARGRHYLYSTPDQSKRHLAEPYFLARIEVLDSLLRDGQQNADYIGAQTAYDYYHLANLQAALGNQSESNRYAQQTVEILRESLSKEDGTDIRFRSMISILSYPATGDGDKRSEPLNELAITASEKLPNDGAVQNMLGVARFLQKDWKAAIKAFERAEELGLAQTDYFLKSIAYAKLDERDNAAEEYEKGVQAWEQDLVQWRRDNGWPAMKMGFRKKDAEKQLERLKSE